LDAISKLFRGVPAASGGEGAQSGARVPRRSNGLSELSRTFRGQEGLCVLDLGPTSPQNISYLTGLGHRTYNEDVLLASRDSGLLKTGDDGQSVIDVDRFLEENLRYENEFFDAVLCWDAPDYLPADLVKPLVQRLHAVTKPKGLLLGFFHTRDAGPDEPYHRYHIGDAETVEMQRILPPPPGTTPPASGPGRYHHFRLQRIFNNRHIENLFHDFSSIKFFLGRDNIREVLVVR
jgi:SAM-dependent methyltransferase